MIKGRRTSPDTGVGPFGNEVASSSGGSNTPGEETGVLRLRGGGIFLTLDEEDVFISGSDERSAWGEFGVGGIIQVGGSSGMVSDGGTCICADCRAVALTSGSAGTMIGFAVSGPLSRSSL